MKKRRQGELTFWGVFVGVVAVTAFFSLLKYMGGFGGFSNESKVERFARMHHIEMSEYPQELLDLAERNSETIQFVCNYPLKKDTQAEIDLNQYKKTRTVPLLMQWDERWGYETYGSGMMALTGCGPTCLSMVAIHLTHDTSLNPKAMAAFSTQNGYADPGNGSSWTLFSEGGKQLGMRVTEIPLDKERIFNNLKVGNPIVCIVGPGDFTTSGHYLVFVGSKDGKIKLNDPNSKRNSEKLWAYEDIQDQIRNLWVFQAAA